MADALYFPGLTPISALELLAGIAQREDAVGILSRISVCVQAPVSFDSPAPVTLYLSSRSDTRTGRNRDTEEAFTEDYRRLSKKANPVADDRTRESYQSLLEGLPRLLLESAASGAGESDPALKDDDVRMVVANGIQYEQAVEILDDLNHWAPPAEIAVREGSDGVCSYYYLVNNRSFDAVDPWATGRPAYCSVPLHCYYVERYGLRHNVFLPYEAAPTRTALEHGIALILAMRGMYDGGDPRAEPRAILAITVPTSYDTQSAQVHYLAHLSFINHFEMRPIVRELANFEVFAGDSSPAAQERLRDALSSIPRAGYRLRLRPAFQRVVDQGAYQAALQRYEEAAQEIDLIESLDREDRPTLLRFTQEQLPALAEVIRAYPVKDTRRLLYAFQADSFRHPEGVHFLLVDPKIPLSDLDPIVYWEGQSEQPMRFWIDPYWAREYYQGDEAAQVYVPYGTVIYPALHSWGVDDMDAYLNNILLRWQKASENGPVPAFQSAVYVFDGEIGHQLDVFVLDWQAFQPLTARLEWLNECLDVQGIIHIEEVIKLISSSKTRQRLADYFTQKEEHSILAYNDVQRRVEQTMAGHSRELLKTITDELTQLSAHAQDLSLRSAELNARLSTLEADYAEMVRLTSMTESLKTRVMAGADALSTYSTEVVRKVEGSIHGSYETRQRLRRQLDSDVKALSDTHEILRLKLDELRRLL